MKYSFVIPIFNEEENIVPLYEEVSAAARNLDGEYEIILVDDGSRDGSGFQMRQLANKDERLKAIFFQRNFGQTAAMAAGFDAATGEFVISLDADLQNDPRDIPQMLKLMEKFDVVCGWRKNRKDNFLVRTLPSKMANWLIGRFSGVKMHDYGCTLRVYRREFVQNLGLYGQMHRFIPALVASRGAKITEMVVNHRPRTRGTSKYGLIKTFGVLADLLVVKFLTKYLNKPMHFFGGFGFVGLLVGILSAIYAVLLKIFDAKDFVETPLPLLSALFISVSVQMFLVGIVAEMLMRTYYESQGSRGYVVKERIN